MTRFAMALDQELLVCNGAGRRAWSIEAKGIVVFQLILQRSLMLRCSRWAVRTKLRALPT